MVWPFGWLISCLYTKGSSKHFLKSSLLRVYLDCCIIKWVSIWFSFKKKGSNQLARKNSLCLHHHTECRQHLIMSPFPYTVIFPADGRSHFPNKPSPTTEAISLAISKVKKRNKEILSEFSWTLPFSILFLLLFECPLQVWISSCHYWKFRYCLSPFLPTPGKQWIWWRQGSRLQRKQEQISLPWLSVSEWNLQPSVLALCQRSEYHPGNVMCGTNGVI